MTLSHLTFSVLFSLSVGFFISMGFVRANKVGPRYYLYHGLGTALLALLAFWALSPETPLSLAVWTFIGGATLYSFFKGRSQWFSWVIYGVALTAAVWAFKLDVASVIPHGSPLFPSPWYFVSNTFLSALVLGFTIGAMLLGHWYLIQPKLPIAELKRLTLLLAAILTLRFILSSWGSLHVLLPKTEIEIYRFLGGDTVGIFLLMRWVWGLIGPLALLYFIWKTVQMRSTQSATGILYVATVLVLAGETVSQYLSFFHGLPV